MKMDSGVLLKSYQNIYTLSFFDKYRDNDWSATFGNIQKELLLNSPKEIFIDFNKCIWMDPNPLLSLILLVEECRVRNTLVNVVIPSDKKILEKQKSFIGFLVKENFLDCLLGITSKTFGKNTKLFLESPNTDITSGYPAFKNIFLKYSSHVWYKNSTCIPADLLKNIESLDIEKYVDGLIKKSKLYSFKNQFDADEKNKSFSRDADPTLILQEVRQVLLELIKNVQEHAYYNFNNFCKNTAIFGRIRYGFSDGRIIDRKDRLILHFKEEDSCCPMLKYSTQLQHIGFVELFVSDLGKGITNDYELSDEKARNSVHPLKLYFKRMPTEKAFSKYSEKERLEYFKSPMPGLKYISDLLSNRSGFLRILQKKEWCGANFPFELNDEKKISHSVQLNLKQFPISGTHFCVRISSGNPLELSNYWGTVAYEKSDFKSKVIVSAFKSIKNCPIDWQKITFHVFDDQEAKIFNTLECVIPKIYVIGKHNSNVNIIVWRPKKSILRDDIPRRLQIISKNFEKAHIIILDQDLSAAIMTHWALRKSKSIRYPNISKISVISNTLCVAEVVKKGSSFGFLRSPSLLQFKKSQIHLGHIVCLLKEIDSNIFWQIAEGNSFNNDILINSDILWESNFNDNPPKTHINKFIDFTSTINHRIFLWIYKRALGRFLSFISPDERPYPIDHIVEAFLSNFFFHRNYDYISKKSRNKYTIRPSVFVGSTVISGETAKGIEDEWIFDDIKRDKIVVHYLPYYKHGELEKEVYFDNNYWLLSWNYILNKHHTKTNKNLLRKNSNVKYLRRIIDSPMICKYGNKHWSLVRKKFGHEVNKNINLYGRSPDNPNGIKTSEAYSYWQTNGILRFGHWVSHNHHDCIGVNLIETLKSESISLEGPLWDFILSHVNRLSPEYKEKAGFKKCHILAAVVNEATMVVLTTLAKNINWINSKIVILPFVQRRRKAMRLRIAPIEELKLKNRIIEERKQFDIVNVLLFDCVISSSRTFRELRNFIRNCGADEVLSFCLLDRTRLPNQQELVQRIDFNRDSRLWRFDLDYLSTAENYDYSSGCQICESEKIIDQIIEYRSTEQVLKRIKEWKQIIKLRKLAISGPLDGLQTEKLIKTMEMNFGIEDYLTSKEILNISYGDKISIEDSNALAAILLEIITITGEHDIVFRIIEKIKKQTLGDINQNIKNSGLKIIITIVTSQLIYLKSDIGYKRKLLLSKELLGAIWNSSQENSATAFACSIILGLDKSVIINLIKWISESYTRLKIGSNFDFHLIFSLMINQIGPKKTTHFFNSDNFIQSIIPIGKPIELKFPYYFIEIIQIVGIRFGTAHRTLLANIIYNKKHIERHFNTVCAIIQRLMILFKRMFNEKHIYPSFSEEKEIESCVKVLDRVSKRLLMRKKERVEENIMRNAYEYLQIKLYGMGTLANNDDVIDDIGIMGIIRKAFTKGINQMKGYVDSLIKDNENTKESKYKVTIDDYYDDDQNKKIIAIFSKDVEICIMEYIDNAFKFSKERNLKENGTDCSIDFEIMIGCVENEHHETAIKIEIKNYYYNLCDIRDIYTTSRSILEILGGTVKTKRSDGMYIVTIILPTVNSMIFREIK